jgi:hypothetical protein
METNLIVVLKAYSFQVVIFQTHWQAIFCKPFNLNSLTLFSYYVPATKQMSVTKVAGNTRNKTKVH